MVRSAHRLQARWQVSVFSTDGARLLAVEADSEKQHLDVRHLPPGVYTLMLHTRLYQTALRFVKY